MPAISCVRFYESVASNHPYRAVILAFHLLGDVNFLFVKLENRTPQSGQTYNGQQKISHN